MADKEADDTRATGADEGSQEAGDVSAEKQRLALEVDISQPGTCERHITVKIPRADIQRYMENALSELAPKAQVRGFRQGRAPRGLVEKQFKDQVADQVKGTLLMDSMTQVTEEHKFAAISEPKFDVDAIKVPDDGPLIFEFDIEVRPDFDMPEWRGLKLDRPVHEYTDVEIDRHLRSVLAKYGQVHVKEGNVEVDDLICLDVVVRDGDSILNQFREEEVKVQSQITFRDAKIDGFDTLIVGANVGDRREAKVSISEDVATEALRGKQVTVEMTVASISHLELPKLTSAFLDKIGGFEDEDELRDAVRKELERQLKYTQHRRIREQITGRLTQGASWDLPPDLLRRQSQRELERSVLELRASGFTDDVIRAHANELRQSNMRSTARALKEHFILERIAEDQKIDAEPSDYENEILLIAAQSGENPRRVRARLDKRGQMDALRNQIVERKVIDLIMSEAKFNDTVLELKPHNVHAVDQALSAAEENAIPEAQHGGEAESLRQPTARG